MKQTIKKEETMNKISKESAKKIWNQICDDFGFSVPTEAKTQKIETKIGNVSATVISDVDNAAITIDKIMNGIIEYNGNADDPKIIYNFKKKIKGIDKLEFGLFTMKKMESTKVPLDKLNGNMTAKENKDVIMVMTGLSDEDVFDEMGFSQFNDLRSIVNYFLV